MLKSPVYRFTLEGLWESTLFTIEEAEEQHAELLEFMQAHVRANPAMANGPEPTVVSSDELLERENAARSATVRHRNKIYRMLADRNQNPDEWLYYRCDSHLQSLALPLVRAGLKAEQLIEMFNDLADEALDNGFSVLNDLGYTVSDVIRLRCGAGEHILHEPFGFLVPSNEHAFHAKLKGIRMIKTADLT